MAKFNFSNATIDALPAPGKGWIYHYDRKVSGLGIGVGNTGKKSFILYRKINGLPKRITLGRYPDLTIEQARDKALKINSSIANGLAPSNSIKTSKPEMTLEDLFNEYMTRAATFNKRPDKPKANYRLYLSQWGKRKLTSIKHEDVDRLHKKLGRNKGMVTANIALKLLHVIYNKAINEWRIWEGENPAHGIKKFPEHSRNRFIKHDELPKFFKALAEEQNDTMRDYFLLSLLTGARRTNVLSMKWKDINLERGEWCIDETKNVTPQIATLSPEALTVLRNRMPTESTFVFPGKGSSGHLIEPKKGWKRILERAGIDDLRINDLRRTLGSWQAKTGASITINGKNLNHKNQNTTAIIYALLNLDPMRESVNTATTAIMRAATLIDEAQEYPKNQWLKRSADFKMPGTEQPKSTLEKITTLARLDAMPYDGIRGTLPVWMPPPVIKEFKQIRAKLQIGDRSSDQYTPDQIQLYIADYPSYLNNQKLEMVGPEIPNKILDYIDRLWVLRYAAELGAQDKQAGLEILHSEETAVDILYGQKYKKIQPEKVSKSGSTVYNQNLTINQIISMLALSGEHDKEIAKELWPHFYSELNDRNFHPYQFEINNDITKWKCEYDYGDKRETITFRQFSNVVSKSRNEFRLSLRNGLHVMKKK